MSVDSTAGSDLDTIFAEVGEFGIYQIAIYLLICIPNALSATFVMNYMFTANTLDYRWVIHTMDKIKRLVTRERQFIYDVINNNKIVCGK